MLVKHIGNNQVELKEIDGETISILELKPRLFCVESELNWFCFTQSISNHEFYRINPKVCQGSYKVSALYQIFPFVRDDISQLIISVFYENS